MTRLYSGINPALIIITDLVNFHEVSGFCSLEVNLDWLKESKQMQVSEENCRKEKKNWRIIGETFPQMFS